MKTTHVTENGVHFTRFGFVNCYLLREADGLTRIDTGMLSSNAEGILAASEAMGGDAVCCDCRGESVTRDRVCYADLSRADWLAGVLNV